VLKFGRTALYLAAAAAIWFTEDIVISLQLGFSAAQTTVLTAYFVLLFAGAVWLVVRTYRRLDSGGAGSSEFPLARVIAMAPAFTLVVGSFAALPVIMLVLALRSVL